MGPLEIIGCGGGGGGDEYILSESKSNRQNVEILLNKRKRRNH